MGMISGTLGALLGNNRNVITDVVGMFRESAEAGAGRDAVRAEAALVQYAAEFSGAGRSRFDQVIDGLNRIPRPAMALGTLALFVAAMVDPIWFAARMQGIALVPEPLWWLLGAIVGFYFGARHQAKGQEFQRSIAETLARTAEVTEGIAALNALEAGSGLPRARPDAPLGAQVEAAEVIDIDSPEPNAALAEWKDAHRR
ncbi:holin family protein [Tropicimonas isoalkanivorans]|uniref:Holin of 3TMs, for gene-transfer release n=1 Tax=Tropicimonas isoalkanivorans TaxID=441112 RepID=A0A1I1E5G3_9RHOB|nr:holin family protein [Tropicimonas isoalkanivorans]SFB80478.1 Holin of 3TMs, for gene-transfer release [Tropicimonas isoalkanivorans]